MNCYWLSLLRRTRSARTALKRPAVGQLPSCCETHDTLRQCMPVANLVQCGSPPTMPVRRTARSRRGSELATAGSQQPYGRSTVPPTQATTASPCPSINPTSFPLDPS
jgi:hypothetical protein